MPLAASAQWQWMDKDGHRVYSDRPPPSDIAPKDILRQPSAAARFAAMTSAAPDAAASAASAPKPPGRDPALESAKKQRDDEQEAKRKAAADKLSKDKSQNCERARSTLAVLKAGVRMKVPSASGEMEFINDTSRAAEIERVQGILASDCK